MKEVPLGVSEFSELIQGNYLFVDTTPLIGEIFREGSKVVLITRPRRFGKTLNMTMLREFFDNRKNTRALFEGLKITQDERVMQEINQHPTIFITFKDIKDNTWEEALANLKNMIFQLYRSFKHLLETDAMDEFDRIIYDKIVRMDGESIAQIKHSLNYLMQWLYQRYNKRVLVLIDEYDVPIQSGWSHGYYDQVIDFMRVFLTAALKDNPYLYKGVLTGVYRVAKESIFSALNNLAVFPLTEESYSQYFGFTQEETQWAIEEIFLQEGKTEQEIEDAMQEVQQWYNGYRFGSHTIYNPWSIISYLRYRDAKPYWVNTSSNDLIIRKIHDHLQQESTGFHEDIVRLLEGQTIHKPIGDSTSLRDVETQEEEVWSLFLMSGYLKGIEHREKKEEIAYNLSIPNLEVMSFFHKTVSRWVSKANPQILPQIGQCLQEGKPETFAQMLQTLATDTLSYYDIQKDQPEHTYHMLVLGMLTQVQHLYHIRSNRESGQGRYDILLKPKAGKPDLYGVIIEIKKGTDKLEEAMDQIRQKEYAQELRSEGCARIMAIALGVEGKQVEMKTEGAESRQIEETFE